MKKYFFKPLLAVLCVAAFMASFTSCTEDNDSTPSYSIENNALGWWHAVDGELKMPNNLNEESSEYTLMNVSSIWIHFTDISGLTLNGEEWYSEPGRRIGKMTFGLTIMNSTTATEVYDTYANGIPEYTYIFTLTSPTEAVMEMKHYREDGTERTDWHEYYELRKIDYVPDWYTGETSD